MSAASASRDRPQKGRERAAAGALLVSGSLALILTALAWADLPSAPLPPAVKFDRLRVEKGAHRLLAYGQGRLLKTYRVSLGAAGPKLHAGDLRTPEGLYAIDRHNAASRFHRSLHVSYPSAAEQRRARAAGYSPGSDIMVHGLPNGLGWLGRAHRLRDWTAGCIAVTDPEIEEIFRATPGGTPIEIRR
jgi:murein L,D-transpeptidase YafK